MAVKSKPAQDLVPIKEVRDGIVILKDGSMRMVLIVSSLNFALKSEDEQAAILLQFQNFLNSLDFSTQIFIQSRRLDIRPYLATLQERLKGQLSDLMRIQIEEYIEFIRAFTESTSIMTKTFFVVVPYTASMLSSGGDTGFLGGILGGKTKKDSTKTPNENDIARFEEARSQLEQRANIVKQGLVRTGVRAIPLGTEELIELYYKMFNPGDTEKPLKVEG
jgi:hypothetical protein